MRAAIAVVVAVRVAATVVGAATVVAVSVRAAVSVGVFLIKTGSLGTINPEAQLACVRSFFSKCFEIVQHL